jgi:hypothetical protein
MALSDKYKNRLDAVQRALENSGAWRDVVVRRPSTRWVGPLYGRLTLALGSDVIQHVESWSDVTAQTAEAAIFTPTTRMHVSVDASGKEVEMRVLVRSRRTLLAIEVLSDRNIFDTQAWAEWPGKWRIALTYPDGVCNVSISSELEQDRSRFDEFQAGLHDDLVTTP